jgi:hypothetical protein
MSGLGKRMVERIQGTATNRWLVGKVYATTLLSLSTDAYLTHMLPGCQQPADHYL